MNDSRFEYFMERTESDLNEIKVRVNKLWDFRILMIGGSIVVSTVSSVLISLAAIYLGMR